jgi:hypothetical protein
LLTSIRAPRIIKKCGEILAVYTLPRPGILCAGALLRPVGMKVLLVGSDPVGCNFILGGRERHFPLAHEFMKAGLERVLNVRVPVGGRVWLRPKVPNVRCTTQLGRDQVVDFVGVTGRERQPIFTENLPLQRSIDR